MQVSLEASQQPSEFSRDSTSCHRPAKMQSYGITDIEWEPPSCVSPINNDWGIRLPPGVLAALNLQPGRDCVKQGYQKQPDELLILSINCDPPNRRYNKGSARWCRQSTTPGDYKVRCDRNQRNGWVRLADNVFGFIRGANYVAKIYVCNHWIILTSFRQAIATNPSTKSLR